MRRDASRLERESHRRFPQLFAFGKLCSRQRGRQREGGAAEPDRIECDGQRRERRLEIDVPSASAARCNSASRSKDLLRRMGRSADAALAYEAALARTDNAAEKDLLRRRRESASGPGV